MQSSISLGEIERELAGSHLRFPGLRVEGLGVGPYVAWAFSLNRDAQLHIRGDPGWLDGGDIGPDHFRLRKFICEVTVAIRQMSRSPNFPRLKTYMAQIPIRAHGVRHVAHAANRGMPQGLPVPVPMSRAFCYGVVRPHRTQPAGGCERGRTWTLSLSKGARCSLSPHPRVRV